ncbi:RraA family protein [Thalassorhabdomicrobium marinisediminis]|uniref:RraA family protein n=1 Tax=Thalassorhabdomicrobium marinisediminis TaxID=2170577 RepID=UPI0024926A8D|nr:RraA family protein [Thalassorhabdomicrobium marinisediminis]
MTHSLSDRLAQCYSGSVYDALRERGIDNTVLPRDIRPIDDTQILAGPVFTIKGSPKPGISADDSLLAWTSFLSAAPEGHVIVSDGGTDEIALMGELSAETLQARGVRGYVTNGGCRDCDFIRKIGFPVFHRFYTARDVVGAWSVDEHDVSVTLGSVEIRSGDYLIADIDGAIVIPGGIVEEIVSEVEEVMNTENKVRTAIRNGTDPKEAYLTYGRF